MEFNAENSMTPTPHASWASLYDEVYELSYGASFHQLTRLTLELVEQTLPPPARVVDFGAGTGRLAVPLATRGYRVAAVEYSAAMLQQLEQNAAGLNLSAHHCPIQDFRSEEKFDMALCVFTVLIYITEEEALRKSLLAVADALTPGGLFLVDIPLRSLFQSNHIQDEQIDRRIRITPLGENRYHYHETTTLFHTDETLTYTDEFDIRCWEVQYMKQVLADCGFSLHADLTTEFFQWGAKYLLMKKAG